ncbi:hypothetical protein [Streptomyces sp. DG2A-72]|uniref:hypothetical protein n=1 Tax=Streptomyces sp. DG2A-72 TaxID=3051386 RepID=UPI00346399EC
MRIFEALLGLPGNLLRPTPDTANRSLTLAETEMLRNLDVEFRGSGLPEGLYSRLVRYDAVTHMKNTCAPGPDDVKIGTPQWAVEAASEIGAEMAGEPRIAPEAAAHALYGAPAAEAAAPVKHTAPTKARTVHQTSSKELVKVLGHRCLKRLRWR